MNYSEIRDSLKTGDIALFSGESAVSRLIQFGTRSPWSHVGMVIRTEGGLQLWESTSLSNVNDIDSGKATRGVQTCWLSDRLAAYPGAVAFRSLKKGLSRDQVAELAKFRREVRGRPYEQSRIELLSSAFDFIDLNRPEDLSSIFCSELLAEFYQRCSLFTDDVPSNEFVPGDYGRAVIPCDAFDSWEREICEVEYDNYQCLSA